MTYTYTYATLEVSQACYDEIKAKLEAAGYQDQFHKDAEVVRVDPQEHYFDGFLCIYCGKRSKITPIKAADAIGVKIKCEHCHKSSLLLHDGEIPKKFLRERVVIDMHGIALVSNVPTGWSTKEPK